MKRAYQYLFYRYYCFQQFASSSKSTPHSYASLLLSAVLGLNIMELFLILDLVAKVPVPSAGGVLYYAAWALLFGANYYVLAWRGKGARIIAQFRLETRRAYLWRGVVFYGYFIGSIVLLGVLMYIKVLVQRAELGTGV